MTSLHEASTQQAGSLHSEPFCKMNSSMKCSGHDGRKWQFLGQNPGSVMMIAVPPTPRSGGNYLDSAISIPDWSLFEKRKIMINDMCLYSHGAACHDQVSVLKGLP